MCVGGGLGGVGADPLLHVGVCGGGGGGVVGGGGGPTLPPTL